MKFYGTLSMMSSKYCRWKSKNFIYMLSGDYNRHIKRNSHQKVKATVYSDFQEYIY